MRNNNIKKMLLCDLTNQRFLAGWTDDHKPIWTEDMDKGKEYYRSAIPLVEMSVQMVDPSIVLVPMVKTQ